MHSSSDQRGAALNSDEQNAHYVGEYLQRHNTSEYVVSRGTQRAATNALKGQHNEYEAPFVEGLSSNRRSTLDRGIRRSNRSIKHDKQWRTSQQERSVLRYSIGG